MHRLRLNSGILVLALPLAAVLPGAASATEEAPAHWRVVPALGQHFQEAGVEGSFLAYSVVSDRWSCHDGMRGRRGFIPASTFKIAAALIGLDSGVLTGPEHLYTWDGVEREFKAWNRDHTLSSAIRESAAWYFQRTARQLGTEEMARYVALLGYGNGDISAGHDRFWLEGDMRISPEEQIGFLRRLYHGTLPISSEAQSTVRNLIRLDEGASAVAKGGGSGWVARGKTGLGQQDGRWIGWLVGWVEQAGDVVFFATNIEGDRPDAAFRKVRHVITRKCLRDLGYLDGSAGGVDSSGEAAHQPAVSTGDRAGGRRAAPASIQPPRAPRRPHSITFHGDSRVDHYYWLMDRENRDTIPYLEAENEYKSAVMRPTRVLQDRLFHEMVGRLKETDLSVPVFHGGYYYYGRTERGQQYTLWCRKKGSLEAPEEVLLDENQEARGLEYYSLGDGVPNHDHRLYGWSEDRDGSEHYTLKFKNLESGKVLDDIIEDTDGTIVWASDGETLFYVTLDATQRPSKVWLHRLGTSRSSDVLVYEEKDREFNLSVSRTKDRAFIVIESYASTSSESRLIPADRPTEEPRLFARRRRNVEYSLYHQGSDFYVHTNDGAVEFKVYRVPDDAWGRRNWKVFIPHRARVKVDGLEVFENHIVVYERQEGLRTMRVFDVRSGTFRDLDFPEPIYSYSGSQNPEYGSRTLRFEYTSMLTPDSVYDVDLETGERALKKRKPVLGAYDPADYEQVREWAESHDGTRVPITLVYRRDLPRDGSAPCYLTGYAAYGEPYDPYFSSNRISLLDRGFVYAIAHARGGEDLGRQWYLDGKFEKKQNSFLDLIACAEFLVKKGYTSTQRLAVTGGSAGGLLVGAAMAMRPDVFGLVVADVPFVDALTTMLDPTIPLTVQEYQEWGNPRKKKYYEAIKAYAPYDNVAPGEYPPMLITAGLNDPRVGYWEPAKLAARLRHRKSGDSLLVLKTNMGAGHGGASGRYDYLKEIAFEYAFILHVFGFDS